MLDLEGLIKDFFVYLECNSGIEIYNEFSFQHELGIFLRNKLAKYYIQFERNASYFLKDFKSIKKEIDIVIFNDDKSEKYAIELKRPLNGQYPEQMYAFIKDLKFIEELKSGGFTKTASVVLVSDRPFYEGNNKGGIYKYFREENFIYGKIFKPTANYDKAVFIELQGEYRFEWSCFRSTSKFYVIEV